MSFLEPTTCFRDSYLDSMLLWNVLVISYTHIILNVGLGTDRSASRDDDDGEQEVRPKEIQKERRREARRSRGDRGKKELRMKLRWSGRTISLLAKRWHPTISSLRSLPSRLTTHPRFTQLDHRSQPLHLGVRRNDYRPISQDLPSLTHKTPYSSSGPEISSSTSAFNISELTIQEYHQISDETLHELTDLLEGLVESDHPQVIGWDVDYSSGVMNFSMSDHGTYVINKQPPNKQIWLSSPFSGPKRFDYDKDRGCWFYSRDGSQLIELMRREVDGVLGDNYFSKLLSS